MAIFEKKIMLIDFAVTNFKSFKERVEFSMLAGNYKRFPGHMCDINDIKLLRASAIYGNNGAGKTNLLSAVAALRKKIVSESSGVDVYSDFTDIEPISEQIPTFKLDNESNCSPTIFEVEFFINKTRYSYYLSIKENIVIEEWLYKVLSNNKTETVFERSLDKDGKLSLKIGDKKLGLKEKVRIELYLEELSKRKSISFFKFGIEKEIEELKEPYNWFKHTLHLVGIKRQYVRLVHAFASDDKFSKLAKQILLSLNIGIDDIMVQEIGIDDFFGASEESTKKDIIQRLQEAKKGDSDECGYCITRNNTIYNIYEKTDNNFVVSKLITKHAGSNENVVFDLSEESYGTRKIMNILPAIVYAILEGGVFFVDEIESSVHPNLIKELIKIYLDAGSDYKSQLIFTTHECNMLDLDFLRQDEIWFTEKNPQGATELYSLAEFKPRFDKDIYKGYLEGKFSTYPFFTNPLNLGWNE